MKKYGVFRDIEGKVVVRERESLDPALVSEALRLLKLGDRSIPPEGISFLEEHTREAHHAFELLSIERSQIPRSNY